MLLPSFSAGLTYEARYGTDSQICQGKGERIQHEVAPSLHIHLPISHHSCKLLPSVACLTRVVVGPAWAFPDAALGHANPGSTHGLQRAPQGWRGAPACPGVEGKQLPAG